jgi:excisionase family DNA binding protein
MGVEKRPPHPVKLVDLTACTNPCTCRIADGDMNALAERDPALERLVSADELASYFSLRGGRRAVYRWIERYDIPRVTCGRRVRFSIADVRQFFEGNET